MLKNIGFAIPTKMITKLAKDLKDGGYTVEKTGETLIAKHGDKEIARALKMRTVWSLRADPEYIKTMG